MIQQIEVSGKGREALPPQGIDSGKARPQADAVLLMCSWSNRSEWNVEMVSLNFASWNRLDWWLLQVEALRRAA